MMTKKRCLFCDEIVATKPEGDYDRYMSCSCAPGGSYRLRRDSYEPINSLPHPQKRGMLHIVSAYIRELTDRDEEVTLSVEDLESIVNSPTIPVTIDNKANRLLQYLYRHAEGAGESVIIHPLASNYNLTYSPNLQELVFIIDKLQNEQLIIREGTSFQLTEQGWREAATIEGGKKLKPCAILIANDEDLSTEWLEKLLPIIEQYGYLPRLLTHANSKTPSSEKYSLERIAESKLIIADLTSQSPEMQLAAGYALGLNIPVIWTVNSRNADHILPISIKEIRPIVWDTAEELAVILQQRLS